MGKQSLDLGNAYVHINPTACSLKSKPASVARRTSSWEKYPPPSSTEGFDEVFEELFEERFEEFFEELFEGSTCALGERSSCALCKLEPTVLSSSQSSVVRCARVAPLLSPSVPPTPRTFDAPWVVLSLSAGNKFNSPSWSTARLWKIASAPPAPLSIMKTTPRFV